MGENCEICGREFKSRQGLVGHRRLSHGEVAKPDAPSEHVLAEALESALDSLGEHREVLAVVQANLESVNAKLDGFQPSLREMGPTKPSLELIDHWVGCSDCSPIYADLRRKLVDRILADFSKAEKWDLCKALDADVHRIDPAMAEHIKEFEEAKAKEPETSEEVEPKRWLITRSDPGKGFKWDFEYIAYVKETEDRAEMEEALKQKGVEVFEFEASDRVRE